MITTGEGGMALTNQTGLAEKLSRLRSHGITTKPEQMYLRQTEEIWNYQQIDLGFNYRMTDLQAALGLSQLNRLDSFLVKRRELALHYNHILCNFPIVIPMQDPRMHSSYHLYPILVDQDHCGKSQREVYQAMHKAEIFVNLHYIPVHRQPFYEGMGFEIGYCPNAERFHRAAISLPIYTTLTGEQQQKIITVLENILSI
jgi:dTDP-4-amino-4,6-dideoxygalactose transaminase